jgi:hypothetical protein
MGPLDDIEQQFSGHRERSTDVSVGLSIDSIDVLITSHLDFY